MTQIESHKVLKNNYSLGFARLIQSAILGLLLTGLIVFAVDMGLELWQYAGTAKAYADFPKWLQYTHIVLMVVAALAVLIAIILAIPGCVYLSNSDTMTNSQVATYVFLFLFSALFVCLNIFVAVFTQVESLKDIIPTNVHPYLLIVGCVFVLAAWICSIILVASSRQQKVNVIEVKKGENQKIQATQVEPKKVEAKEETPKKAKPAKKHKKAKKAKKHAKRVKRAKKAPAKSPKAESMDSVLMIENAELREELDHLKRSRSAEKGWVSRKDDELENKNKK